MAMCPGDTTEWDDIQRKFGNLPPLEKEVPQRELDQRLIESADSCKQFCLFLFFHQLFADQNYIIYILSYINLAFINLSIGMHLCMSVSSAV